MGPAEGAPTIAVEVVYCAAPHQVDLTPLSLPDTATVADALHASGVLRRHALDADSVGLGIWGRTCRADQRLRDRDRVELTRPLQVDPKEARRQRYRGKRTSAA
jgi:putative ubiquitin-RnfH superfamily antitoxin RatB of RatAB toxin-antitoxin module